MPYRHIVTLDLPEDAASKEVVYDALEKLDDLDVIVREEGFPTHTVQRFAAIRWFNRRVADVRYFFRQRGRGDSDAMCALRAANEDCRALGLPHVEKL